MIFGAAATLGWLDLAGYLTSRRLSIILVRPDAVALAFRAPWTVVLALLLVWVWRGWHLADQAWRTTHPKVAVAISGTLTVIGLYYFASRADYKGVVMVLALVLLALYVRAPAQLLDPPRRTIIAAAVLIAYVFANAFAVGASQIENVTDVVPLAIVTTERLSGLSGNDMGDGRIEYLNLFLVHSDEGSLFVSSRASPERTWIIQWSKVADVVSG